MRIFALVFLLIFALPNAAAAQSIIRDTEIEGMLRSWSTPIFQAAGLVPDNVNIILIQSPDVNAFVAGGANIFLYTGLLERAENPGEIIGVIAHETGHISGGHLVQLRGAIEQASYETIIGTILGIGAAVLTGEGAAAHAIIAGTQNVAGRRFLANSRVNESSADQAGLKYMEAAGLNPEGLKTFLQKLEGDELLPPEQQSEYVRTHPLTGNRISALSEKVKSSPYYGDALPANWQEDFARMKAKLKGFISPEQVAWAYPDSDTSISADYARAIAAYRMNRVDHALGLTNNLISREPQNPFFQELKGQMLVDFGRVKEAKAYYARAIENVAHDGLLRVAYAHTLIESSGQNTQDLEQAIRELEIARNTERRSTRIYRLLATAHGRLGREVEARLNLAEEALLQKRLDDAARFARYVMETAAEGSSARVRASDILNFIEENG